MSINHLIIAARSLLGDSAVITDQEQMLQFTTSMRHRHSNPSPVVVLPKSVEQVSEIVRLCAQYKISCVPQGGNTGLVDGGIPRTGENEVIISLSRMNKIRDIDTVGLIATVESGVILQKLRETLSAKNMMFPLSIASEGSAEIGGLISTNAGGLAALRYGTMRNLVLGIEAVLPNGEIISNLKSLSKDNTGYHLSSYFIGAEGTLGIVTAATLRLLPATHQKATAVVAVPDISAALELLKSFRCEFIEHLSAFEFMSLEALQLLMKNVEGSRFPGNSNLAPYYLLLELNASSDLIPLRNMLEAVIATALNTGTASDAVIAESEAQAAQFWHAREHIPDALRVEKQRLHFDIAVPVKSLAGFMGVLATNIKALYPDIVLMPFGHIGDGNIHYNMYWRNHLDPEQLAIAKKRIQDMVFNEVDRWQGSISAEHGVGVERKAVLAKLKSSTELDVMRSIKHALDPDKIMNPGKIFD